MRKREKPTTREVVVGIVEDMCNLMVDPQTDDNIYYDLGMDSLDVEQFVMDIERYYGIVIPSSFSERLRNRKTTLGDLVRFTYEAVAEFDNKKQ